MPFTISHTAAVLPFSRWLARWHLLSAVLIGSMVPDFGMFAPWHLEREQTHSALALLTFSLPVGLLAYWLFEYLIKAPVLELLPNGAYLRWHDNEPRADIGNPLQWVRAACGVVAGAVTHLVWDAFTHEGARGVRMIPSLTEPVLEIGGHRWAGARLLQDGSSLMGLFIIGGMLCYALRPAKGGLVVPRRLSTCERHGWTLAYLLATVVFSALLYVLNRWSHGAGHGLGLRIVQMAFASVRGLVLALLLISVALQRRLGAYP